MKKLRAAAAMIALSLVPVGAASAASISNTGPGSVNIIVSNGSWQSHASISNTGPKSKNSIKLWYYGCYWSYWCYK